MLDKGSTLYNHMVMESKSHDLPKPDLDAVFAALADPTRREILRGLAAGEASVKEIGALFTISQPAITKHLKVLERAGLIIRGAERQRRPARLNAAPMKEAVAWLEEFECFWGASFDRLDTLLEDLKAADARDTRMGKTDTRDADT